jgi:CheY-like chemotaxis protein/HPt (histidine-containing phosphotransfer) domain-containing protein
VLLGRHDAAAEKAFIHGIKTNSHPGAIKWVRLAPFGIRANPEELSAGGFATQINVPFRLSQLTDCLLRVLNQTDDRPVLIADPAENKPGCGLKILVVDDNDTNLIVISKILEKLGHMPTNVTSGADALAALKHPGFDLVLMDCQMPEMDGYEATRRIRAGESGETAKTLPIVALTANVYASDQQLCLDSGMDDYLCKPIQMDKLKALLAHYQKKQQASAQVNSTSTIPPTATSTGHDTGSPTGKIVLNLTDLMDRMLDDFELARSTAEAFLQDLPGQIAAVKKAVQVCDPAATAAAAHRLRGAAGTMGGDALHQVLTDIEQFAKSKKMAEATRCAALIDREAERLTDALTEQILNVPADPAGIPFPV